MACVWRLEDSFQELTLRHLLCMSLTQVARRGSKHLCWSSPSHLVLLNFMKSPVCVLKAAIITCAYELITDVLNQSLFPEGLSFSIIE